MALKCRYCQKGRNTSGALKKHEKTCGLGVTTHTKGGSDRSDQTTSKSLSDRSLTVTSDFVKDSAGLPDEKSDRSLTVTASTSSPDDLVVGVTGVTESDRDPRDRDIRDRIINQVLSLPAPGVNSPDAIETMKDRAVIDFLAGHTGLLEPRELRFFHGVKYRVYGNGGLSPAQRGWLYEIEAVVKGLLAEIARETEQSRRAQHWLAVKDPKHKMVQGCDLCRELEIERAEADKRADIGLLDDAKIMQQTAKRKGLRVPTIEELMGEAMVQRVTARSLQGDPAARACIENLREFSA